MSYGNFDLQRGDHDGNPSQSKPPCWGGIDNPQIPTQTAQTPVTGSGATLVIPAYVEQLQRDLRELGFAIVGTPDGVFGRHTEWAVREFQIYAGMSHIAQLDTNKLHNLTGDPHAGESAHEVAVRGAVPSQTPPVSYYVATLNQATNNQAYNGPISGVANQDTRQAIQFWLDHNYRCPVVIEAWKMSRGSRQSLFRNQAANPAVNIWDFDKISDSAPRFFFRDFTQYYQYPTPYNPDEYQVLGDHANYLSWNGPRSITPNHTWGKYSEILPNTFLSPSISLAQLPNQPQASKYRVVRAVSEVECEGQLDAINCYDNALLSFGPCHWTMGINSQGSVDYTDGELPAFLSYLYFKDQQSYMKAFGNFGLYPSEKWLGEHVSPLWKNSQKKYTGWIQKETENNTNQLTAGTSLARTVDVDQQLEEANYYKSWHWFFRWVMAARTITNIRPYVFDMALMRIRDILSITLSSTIGGITIDSTLGDIYTSELAVAILLRWHIRKPAHVCEANDSGSYIQEALESAFQDRTINWSLPISSWTDKHEKAITDSLYDQANNAGIDGIDKVKNWPNWSHRSTNGYTLTNQIGNIKTGRNSFN